MQMTPLAHGDVASCFESAPLNALRAHVFHALDSLIRTQTSSLAVALSGGADSLALTLLAQEWAAPKGVPIVALTVDHRLRAESSDEAVRVHTWMRARGIAHYILTPPHTEASRNLQEAARTWRYDALADYCAAHGILHCLVAHTAGDNRETVAHHRARGDTADGPSGMRRVRRHRGVRFVRPLLAVERGALESYLRTQGAEWINDPSNADTRFTRVRIRKELEDDPAQCDKLNQLLTRERAARAQRDEALARAAIRCVKLHPLGYAALDVSAWRQLTPTLASQLLADVIRTVSGATYRPRVHETLRLATALMQDALRKRTLLKCEIAMKGTTLHFSRELAHCAPPVTLQGIGALLWDARFHVRYAFLDTTCYTLRALGRDGLRQWQAQFSMSPDTAHASLLSLPLSSPSLWHLDELLYVPHIGMALPENIKVQIGFHPAKPLAELAFW